MVSNKVLLGRAGGVIRGSGFSKYRESHAYNSLVRTRGRPDVEHTYHRLSVETQVCAFLLARSEIRERLERTSISVPATLLGPLPMCA